VDTFIDEITITVQSGKGGSGLASFHRERFKPVGPPDGGDGGRGGDVVIRVNPQLSTLFHLYRRRHFKALNGDSGMKLRKHGKNADTLYIDVPRGCRIINIDTNEIIADLSQKVTECIIAKGGDGGKGNSHFKTATNRSPRKHGTGWPGETKTIKIELLLIADVGLVGLPNAGKSTLLAALTAARPKIDSYPFTTISPNLGVARVEDEYGIEKRFTIADIPGLIENAHIGAGLGLSFLRHIKRTHVVVFVIDMSDDDCIMQYTMLMNELQQYDRALTQIPSIIVGSKIDIDNARENIKKYHTHTNQDILPLSSHSGEGLEELKKRILSIVSMDSSWNEQNS